MLLQVPDTAVVLYSLLNRLADSEAPKAGGWNFGPSGVESFTF